MKHIPVALALALSVMPCAAARADGAADDAAVRNHITCYPFGIDKIGRGDLQGGIAIWKECFAPDFAFSAFIGRGEPVNCPGPSCPFPKQMTAIDMRAAFAKRAFDGGGFVKTSHHLTNVTIGFPASDRATVNAYVQAWHWKADNTVVVAPGTWDVELVRSNGKWLISDARSSPWSELPLSLRRLRRLRRRRHNPRRDDSRDEPSYAARMSSLSSASAAAMNSSSFWWDTSCRAFAVSRASRSCFGASCKAAESSRK